MEKKFTITGVSKLGYGKPNDKNQFDVTTQGSDFMDVSDGYHTMDELYHHRIVLWIAFCKMMQREWGGVWRSKLHSDGTGYEGWFVLGIFQNAGEQITYHLPMSEWTQTDFAETLEKAPEFDGHSSDDVLLRITNL